MDSQVALGIATKGRVLVKLTALLLALDVYPTCGYVATEVNPADRASWLFDEDGEQEDQ